MRVERKKYCGILVLLITASILFAVYSAKLNVKVKKEMVIRKYILADNLNYYVYLKPNILFSRKVLKNSMIYDNITKNIVVRYSFLSRSSSNVCGKYEVVARLVTKEWNKSVVIVPEKTFKNHYTLSFPVDLHEFRSLYHEINRELDFRGTSPKVIITIKTYVNGENFSDIFLHTLTFPLLSKAFRILTRHESSKVKTLKKTIYVFDENRYLMKKITGAIAFLLFLSACIFCWRVKPVEKDPVTKLYERNRDFIILGKLETKGSKITVDSFNDLLKVAEILNKPIVKDDKKFGLVDGNTVYIFEFKEK